MTLHDVLAMHQAATERNDTESLKRVEKAYLRILEDEPANPQILQLLGTLYIQTSKNPLAIQILERCVFINPDIGEAWNNLGNAYRVDNHSELAERCYKEAVRCDPENGENWNNWGTNYVNEGHPAEGEEILRKAVKYSPENPHAWWNLSLVLLEQGKYDEGFQYYHYGNKAGIRFERFYNCPEWDGEKTDHLILYGEQGIGDEIMYMTLIPMIKNVKKLSIDCHPRLINMFKRAYPDVEFYPTRKERTIDWHTDQNFTARMSLGDLPKFFIKKAEDFPKTTYLSPVTSEFDPIVLPNSIGISWEGGKKKTHSNHRSMTLEDFLPIIKARPDINWVSLQYTPKTREIVEAFNQKHGTKVKHYSEVHEFDYDRTLNLVSRLDGVITVNTSLVHLCGAAGVKAKVLTPFGKAWRYYSQDGKHMAWYGEHIEMYQQGEDRDWTPVINEVVKELENDK